MDPTWVWQATSGTGDSTQNFTVIYCHVSLWLIEAHTIGSLVRFKSQTLESAATSSAIYRALKRSEDVQTIKFTVVKKKNFNRKYEVKVVSSPLRPLYQHLEPNIFFNVGPLFQGGLFHVFTQITTDEITNWHYFYTECTII